eukprot:scaffold1824_cov332-Prasinococcus_capsulatus_cf.AAC.6
MSPREDARQNPSYQEVCSGRTGHVEVLQLSYNPAKVSYEEICKFFFTFHDPTTKNRQGNDVGQQYASVVFAHSPEQKAVANRITALVQKHIDSGDLRNRFINAKVTTEVYDATKVRVCELRLRARRCSSAHRSGLLFVGRAAHVGAPVLARSSTRRTLLTSATWRRTPMATAITAAASAGRRCPSLRAPRQLKVASPPR